MLTYTLYEKFFGHPQKPVNCTSETFIGDGRRRKVCQCGRDFIEYDSRGLPLHAVHTWGKTLSGSFEKVACCPQCHREEILRLDAEETLRLDTELNGSLE